MQPKYLYNQLQ